LWAAAEGGEGGSRWEWERERNGLKKNWGEWDGYNIVGKILEIRRKFSASTRSEIARGWVLMVAGGWLLARSRRESEDGGALARRRGQGKNFGI
jgi:hypothetical protein